MTTRKRNEWLEADLEDEENEIVSEEEEETRGGLLRRLRKRAKISDDELSDDQNVDSDGEAVSRRAQGSNLMRKDDPEAEDQASLPEVNFESSKIQRKLAKSRDAVSRSGVVYLSHIPPFMKPQTLKNLLMPYASSGLGRIFLTPEDSDRRHSRIKAGGNKKKSFVDGWVEFVSKREAKMVVETLNTRTIGGKKGGYYFDDVWSLKYLKGFKWHHLTDQIANENAERDARMRAEGSASRREMREFLRNVEISKIDETRKKKKVARGEYVEEETRIDEDEQRPARPSKKSKLSKPIPKNTPSIDVNKTLSKIFS
jgi:ESF2/ABP1 family protein